MPGYDSWKTRSPDNDLSGEQPTPEQERADWEDTMQRTLKSTHFDEVSCEKLGYCEWPECQCRRKEPHGTFACPICGEDTPHHHSTEAEKRAECSGCMNPACEDCFDLTTLSRS